MNTPDNIMIKNCYICNREIFRSSNARITKERRSKKSVCCSRRCSKKYGLIKGNPRKKFIESKLKMDKETDRPNKKSKKKSNKGFPYRKRRNITKRKISSTSS